MIPIALALTVGAASLTLESPTVKDGQPLPAAHVHSGYGCTGQNVAPALSWKNAPEGTRSFALTVYDPDAPTGSGFWHWVVYDIPADATGLPAGAASLPPGTKQGHNDFGLMVYSGACPPPGDKPHRYVFTLFALKTGHVGLPPDSTAAMIGFKLNANVLAKATLTATYGR
jgi:Raf kinase inhibitor-like YbhB/YbcL family protein